MFRCFKDLITVITAPVRLLCGVLFEAAASSAHAQLKLELYSKEAEDRRQKDIQEFNNEVRAESNARVFKHLNELQKLDKPSDIFRSPGVPVRRNRNNDNP